MGFCLTFQDVIQNRMLYDADLNDGVVDGHVIGLASDPSRKDEIEQPSMEYSQGPLIRDRKLSPNAPSHSCIAHVVKPAFDLYRFIAAAFKSQIRVKNALLSSWSGFKKSMKFLEESRNWLKVW